MGLKGDDWQRVFSGRYRLALFLVAFVWSTVSVIQFQLINAERERAEVIAMAAEQAALSQRIAFLTAGLDKDAEGCTNATLCVELLHASERMESNHLKLTGVAPEPGTERFLTPLADVYAAGATPFSQEVQEFLDAACQLARDAIGPDTDRRNLIFRIENSGTNTVMQTHWLIVEILEAEARRAIQLAGLVTALGWLSALVLIGLISQRIFGPMAERLGATLNQMEEAQREAEAAAELAAKANRARGAFLKTASHELKTPLNAIMGLAEVIRDGRDGADRLLQEMSHASDHLLIMLNTMLDTHRLDEGRLELTPEPTVLVGALREVSEIAADLAARKGLRYRQEITVPDAFKANVDATRLRQICLNVLDNAVRFTREGEVTFRAGLDDHQGQPYLAIEISDTGIGISRSRQQSVFERYAESAFKPGTSGFGLSLALTKTIVDMMGGEIELSSELGSGSTFFIRLPINRARPAGSKPPAKTGARVLIVDDNRPNRLVADAMMTMLGSSNILCEDGQAAVNLAMQEPFDLILMDIAMPVMDGLEAMKVIRNNEGPNQATPIIAVTAHVAPEEVGEFVAEGFQAVVHKPMRKALMADIFERYVAGPGSAPLMETGSC